MSVIYIRVSVATDASASGWGAILLTPHREEISDYWTEEQCKWGIAAKEATAVDMALMAFKDKLFNARVDAFVDNKAVVEAWSNQGGRSLELRSLAYLCTCLTFRLVRILLMLHQGACPTQIVNCRMVYGRLFKRSLVVGKAILATLWPWIRIV